MKAKLVIFDMDGTILYTLTDLANSLNLALTQHGYPTRTLQEVRSFVGNGVKKLVERGLPTGTTQAQFDLVFDTFFSHYKEHSSDNTMPYDGIVDLLKALKSQGILTAVVSNKEHNAVLKLCDRFFSNLFDCAIGEMPSVKNKPAPDSVYLALDKLGIDQANTLYVGDSDVDMMTAKNANVKAIAVTWGYKDKDELIASGATLFVDRAEEILDLLEL